MVQHAAKRMVLAEQPWNASTWKRTAWRRMKALLKHGATVKGCAVGLKCVRTGNPVSKEWHFRTNSVRLANKLRKLSRCTCPPGTQRVACTTVNAKRSEEYPPKLCKTIVSFLASSTASGGTHPAGSTQTNKSDEDYVTRGLAVASTRKWRRKQLLAHWSKTGAQVKVRKRMQQIASAAERTAAPSRKRCRGLVPSCLGGLSVSPSNVEARALLKERFGQMRVYCRRCLNTYMKRYCNSCR